MKDYVKRTIDNYRMKHREKYLEYQKAYKRTEAYKERNRDVRMKQFKISHCFYNNGTVCLSNNTLPESQSSSISRKNKKSP